LGAEEKTIEREELDTMVKDYYRLSGWDENGVPKQNTLTS
jgi:aldehyde:ferredoxin oxidoreductase